uniref:Uncharacterized protein n=1 Tax=viral metagenome TaxID=1070528 RepID=A0A6C0I0I1_9ZZZZ
MSDFSEIHNIVINAALNDDNKCTIVLKPTKGPKNKIQHYSILKAIENSRQLLENHLDQNRILEYYLDPRDGIMLNIIWEYSIKEIGEYTYYYLSMKALDIKLNIVKKNDNSSICVFLKYSYNCHYLVAIILDKYLKNYWKIENY